MVKREHGGSSNSNEHDCDDNNVTIIEESKHEEERTQYFRMQQRCPKRRRIAEKKQEEKEDEVVYRNISAGRGRADARAMLDSTALYQEGQFDSLRKILFGKEGYLLIRNVIPSDAVEAAQKCLKAYLRENDNSVNKSNDDTMRRANRLLDRQDLADLKPVRRVLEATELFALFKSLFDIAPEDGTVLTVQYKWLRAVQNGENTGIHYDGVYLGREAQHMLTAWIPISDVPLSMGGMMIVPSSHNCDAETTRLGKIRETYGRTAVGSDGVESGWYSNDPAELADCDVTWRTSDFHAGDIVVLTMDTLHMTANNVTSQVRLSCDTRWMAYRWHEPVPRFKWGLRTERLDAEG